MSRKLINEEVLNICKKYDLEWISGDYIGATKPIICKDKNGYVVLARIANLKYWNGATSPFHHSNPFTLRNIKLLLLNNNLQIKLLTKKYLGNTKPLLCKCKICNYEWDSILTRLQKKSGCPKCAGVVKLSLNEIKKRIFTINPNILILSGSHQNTKSKLHCKCLIKNCGNKWNAICSNLLQGRGCPKCVDHTTNNHGLYNETIAERNKKEWITEIANIYIIKCFNNEESFYKIGITKKPVKKRICRNIPYKRKIIYTIETNRYDGTYIEKALHKLHETFKYLPKIKFDGYTECFTKLVDDATLKLFLTDRKLVY